MELRSQRAAVELFHLVVLDLLGRKVDKRFYALKGGCNLRFFMRSFRYSEDMDFDVAPTLPTGKLQTVVQRILASLTLEQVLGVNGIALEKVSAPKQTETTQRWKFTLAMTGSGSLFPTKIEFSRRGLGDDLAFEPVDPVLIETYRLPPIMVSHYTREAAFAQKVEALAARKEPQARDVFDLFLLLQSGLSAAGIYARIQEQAAQAKANAWRVTFDRFKAQVLSCLEPDHQKPYDAPEVWDNMVLKVVAALEGGQP